MKKELLAPNGKPSNLTAEKYELVRTDAFKKWFGDWENDPANASKVVDENGEPLVCNHSSREKNIDIFYGDRIFRTNNISVKPLWFSYKNLYAKGDDIINYKCFLNVRKIFRFFSKEDMLSLEKYMNEKHNNFDIDSEYDYNNNWEAIEDENLPAFIYELGYDGYITNVENAIVVYNSNQIKLADGTNTTFNKNNNDIRFEKGGIADSGTPDYLKFLIG